MKKITLKKYIDDKYAGSNQAFGRANGVSRSIVGQWLNVGYFVIGNELCLSKRKLK